MRVLTWNLFHGRSIPAAGHDLEPAFAAALAGWSWDVALLQEVPPWWPAGLARAVGGEHDTVLTSRNALLCVRRPLARRWPDVLKSGGGGANAIVVRAGAGTIAQRRFVVLRTRPERRVAHGVRVGATWFVNLHAQVHSEAQAQADIALATRTALAWAGDGKLVLGGDLNVQVPIAPGLQHLGGHKVDHLLGRDVAADGSAETPDRGALSDHAPVIVTLKG